VKKAALTALEGPLDAAKTAQGEQEKLAEDAKADDVTAKGDVTKAEADLTKQQVEERELKANSKAANEKQTMLESTQAEAEKTASDAEAVLNTARAKVAESTGVLERAEKTRSDAELDYSEKEAAATAAGDKYQAAQKEAQHEATVSLPAAKNEVTQAKQAADASKNLAAQEKSNLKTAASKAKRVLTPLQIDESGAFKQFTKEHKESKTLERALSNANLQSELSKRKAKFDENLAEIEASKVDSANQNLIDAKTKYADSQQQLEKLGVSTEVVELAA